MPALPAKLLDGLRRSHVAPLLGLALVFGPMALTLHGCGGDGGVFVGDLPPGLQSDRDDQDLLTVMSFNTFLLRVNVLVEVDVASNIGKRSERIATWFQTLSPEELPDVLVMQEIYSEEAQQMLRKLCSSVWTKNEKMITGRHAHDPYIPCDVPNSPFAYSTRVLNPRSRATAVKTGGVVVLVKKGILMTSTEDIEFPDCAGQECFTAIGFWAVTIQKGTQKYWFFGLHAIAYMKNAAIRAIQYAQVRKYIDDRVEDGARLVLAGDFNVATGPYVEETGGETFVPDEFEPMLKTLGHAGNPATVGDLQPQGFWLPMTQPMNATWDPRFSHVIAGSEHLSNEGLQTYDWVVAPGSGDRLATPVSMRYQVVPVKSDDCFVSDDSGYTAGTTTDDLSDHYAVFAEVVWTSDMEPSSVVVQGHRGASGAIPAGPFCEEPESRVEN